MTGLPANGDVGGGRAALRGASGIAGLLRACCLVRAGLGGRLPTRGDLGTERMREALGLFDLGQRVRTTPAAGRLIRISARRVPPS